VGAPPGDDRSLASLKAGRPSRRDVALEVVELQEQPVEALEVRLRQERVWLRGEGTR
jgi:hypothetical protein